MNSADPYGTTQQSNGLSIAALILGIVSLLLGLLTAVPGIIVGHIARSRVKSDPQRYGGGGMALAGLILSYAVIILTLISAYIIFNNPELMEAFRQGMEQTQQGPQ